MNKKLNSKSKRVLIIVSLVLTLLVIFGICFSTFVGDYYHATENAIEATHSDSSVSVYTNENGVMVFEPQGDIKAGMIFYPGGKVEYTSYAPLLKKFANEGILCIMPQMPFNLALLGIDKAKDLQSLYPEIESWYMAGHSLGGVSAANYIVKDAGSFDGIIFLASFSIKDLKEYDLNVLSIYGSQDKVLKMEKYQENLSNFPTAFTEIVIDGGCHSYFGDYGLQEGDGEPTLTVDEQMDITADAVINFVEENMD